jgi:UDP-3-O-[3-hydroxymyristoyl] glucosamine N-acyltransferase
VEITLDQLATLAGGQVGAIGSKVVLTGFAALRDAREGDFSFFGNERYLPDLRDTKASAVLVPATFAEEIPGVALVRVENPSASFAEVVKRFLPPPRVFQPGIHPSAVIDPATQPDPSCVCIGAGAIIGAGVEIGAGSEIGAGCILGDAVKIGKGCLLHPRVTLYHHTVLGDRVTLHSGVVLGADGFGYEFVDGRHRKIDQVGMVQIDDDVEIGANTTIDRARFGRTWIREGAKIDNQVQIGHNVTIGRHCIIIAQVGIAGSTHVGDYTVIAAQAGLAGHLEIGPQLVIGARAGVTKSLLEKGQYMGFPAAPAAEVRKQWVHIRKIGGLLQRVAALEKKQD